MSDEETSEKPKKAYQIKVLIWDDGEVDCDIREYRKIGTGRGAPTLCGPLKAKELLDKLEFMGIDPKGVCEAMAEELGIESGKPAMLKAPPKHKPVEDEVEEELLEDDEDEDDDGISEEDMPDFDDLEA